MKLRIRGNSVRLRVTRSELAQLAEQGEVADAVDFGPTRLEYRLVRDDYAERPGASYAADVICVRVPAAQLMAWAGDDAQVSIDAEQALPGAGTGGDGLRILVEKDFACLQPRRGEDDSDMFAHPDADSLTC